jgi:3-hydroxy-9,10-secoandrosta-1,3,5(10)-triene-9,17-dione monooxygenase reductase component
LRSPILNNAAQPAAGGAAPIDTVQLRRALGSFVTGVTVVTTVTASGEPVGLTVNSFNAVSLSPPLVLWSLALSAASFGAFEHAPHFAVNVLAQDQRALAERFARTGSDKFTGIAWRAGNGGLPLLEGSVAHFVCRTAMRYPGGDHVILIGEVLEHEHSERAPLVYARGRYAQIAQG